MFTSIDLPQGFSLPWSSALIQLSVFSDSLIALAYVLISLLLLRIVRGRRDLPFDSLFFCFSAFILSCGATHVLEVVTLWHPVYLAIGFLKAVTGLIALAALVLLLRVIPAIVAMPSHADMDDANDQMISVLESTTVCVLAVDRMWNIHYMNRNAASLLSVGRDIQGMTLWDAFPAQLQEERAVMMKVMETRQPVSYESFYAPLDLTTTVQAHPWANGGLAVFFSDISAQKRLERELDEERARRNQRIEVLARLSSGLAHEIKNPLAIIHARASDLRELAEEGEVDRAEIAKTCASIVQTSDRAIRILRGVAAMARVGTHDPMVDADVAGMVQQAVELVEGRYRVAGIRLKTNIPGNLPMLECREVQISQILLNLLNNAFDAVNSDARSERWVRVQITIQPGTQHENHIDRLQIAVIDGGPGVAPEHKERLMQTFFTTKSMGAGIGIGLSVSRTIAEEHGGQLELRESDGHTCFLLTLPVSAGKIEEIAA
jgi:C4-dicarboxylate-specific signal transduction histidine kinase